METIVEKLEKLREEMKKEQILVYVIPTDDAHLSEFVGEHFQARRFMSGFTGSSGTLVVTPLEAALFTDGRYFVQAEMELKGSTIMLMREGVEGVPKLEDYVDQKAGSKGIIGFDGNVMAAKRGQVFAKKHKVREDVDLVGRIWKDRPALPFSKVWILEEKYCGESVESKLSRVRQAIKDAGADCHVLSAPEDIAWLFNLRGSDIAYNPVVLAHAIIYQDKCRLFIDEDKLGEEVRKYLTDNGITICAYEKIHDSLQKLQEMSENFSVLLDESRINYALFRCAKTHAKVVQAQNPTVLMKAVKNRTEIENLIRAHIKDGVAVTKFMYWLKMNVGKMEITEQSAADYLEKLRRKQEAYMGPSFATICAYKENAAMMHYHAENGSNAVLKEEGALLVDSGGQYLQGTTDITRTIGLGEVSEEFRRHYTAVLKGMLNLSYARFLKGCGGINLDILARGPLWDMALDYQCGTGHGVGYLLNVHEGPNRFGWKKAPGREEGCVLEAGMITTDEPGVYLEGKYGIRIENELLVEEDVKNEYGQFLKFRTITMAPIDTSLIDFARMENKDKMRLQKYHEMVYETLETYLDLEEKKWFKECFLTNVI